MQGLQFCFAAFQKVSAEADFHSRLLSISRDSINGAVRVATVPWVLTKASSISAKVAKTDSHVHCQLGTPDHDIDCILDEGRHDSFLGPGANKARCS